MGPQAHLLEHNIGKTVGSKSQVYMIGIEKLDVKIEGTLNDTTIDFPKQLQRALVTFKKLH